MTENLQSVCFPGRLNGGVRCVWGKDINFYSGVSKFCVDCHGSLQSMSVAHTVEIEYPHNRRGFTPMADLDPRIKFENRIITCETCHEMMDRSVDASIQCLKQLHDAVGDTCFAWGIAADDSGTQRGEFISPDLWVEMVKPHYAKLCDWVHKNTGWKTFLHSCGSVYNLIPHMIDAGIDILNPIQTSAANMEPELLKAIGRIHSDTEAITAVEAAHQAGFKNFNLDLMFGLPGQTQKQALQDLQMAKDLKPAHISWYELTIEPNTWFHRHPPQRPDDDTLWEMQQAGRTLLEAAGYQRYEVSAYARAQQQCRHNMNYWQFGDYLGIGAGAHAKISDAATQSITRTAKQRHPRNYLDSARTTARISSSTRITKEDVLLEFAMNALRLDQGFSLTTFNATTGLSYTDIEPIVNKGVADGLLSHDESIIRATPKGQRYLNELLQHWMPDTRDHD